MTIEERFEIKLDEIAREYQKGREQVVCAFAATACLISIAGLGIMHTAKEIQGKIEANHEDMSQNASLADYTP